MNKAYIGIDIGTSSVKVLCKYKDGSCEKAKARYDEISPDGWYRAVLKALSELDTSSAAAIGLSSQVGTYIINENEVINWNDAVGADELKEIKGIYNSKEFISEISMPHPDITSYPIPRLKYIQKRWGDGAAVCQPKDLIGKMLTGSYATDKYSWRGLANTETGAYSDCFLKEVGSPELPRVIDCTAKLGVVSEEACKLTGLPQNTPVYIGLNDFFASLLGMGISGVGDMFDITGTSEHLGIITDALVADTKMVSGPYIRDFVHYGVTASSGASLDFGIRNFGLDKLTLNESLVREAPVFTPYLCGERAPIFDSNATGMFFGINAECTREHLAYSVLEGVVFSIYHIYESIGFPAARTLKISGGAAQNSILNFLKAEMLNIPAIILEEGDTSALGASMVAAIGNHTYSDTESAIEHFCGIKQTVEPTGRLRPLMLKRFEIYKELYPLLKNTSKKFKEVRL